MDGSVQPGSAQAGPCSDGTAQRSDTTRPDLALGSALHHKLSLATTRSTSSASSSSHRSYPVTSSSALNRPPYHPLHSESLQSQQSRSRDQPKRLPVYVRIVPKDIWLRIHINPSQSIGSIKDTALLKANAPEHDPSLSYRFYQDALNASAHAKLAPVASHDKVVKHRSYALPRTFFCSPPDLSDVTASLAASMANARRSNRPLGGVQSATSSTTAPSSVLPLPMFDSAYSPRQAQRAAGLSTSQQLHRATSQAQMSQDGSASPGSRTRPLPLSRALGGSSSSARSASDDAMGSSSAHVTRQISSSTLATSPPSTPSDFAHNIASVASDASQSGTSHSHFHAANEIAIRLDASLITGNRDAKLEEDQARLRFSQWNARRASSGAPVAPVAQQARPSSATQHEISSKSTLSPSQSINSTPTIGSSSNFDSEAGSSPNMLSSSGFDAPSGTTATNGTTSGSGQVDRLHATTTPPRRPVRSEQRLEPTTATFYSQPGASESFNSLASISSPSSSELVTTADDDAAVMQWGTQAEADVPLSDQPSPSRTRSSAAISPLSSPLQPSAPTASTAASLSTASSPVRPRSRTVTAADVLRSRAGKDEPPPPMPDVVSSPVRKSSLPKVQGVKMVAESSQRRAVPDDLMELLKGSPEDQDEVFSTVQQRRARGSKEALTLRKKSSDGSAAGAMGGLSSPSSAPSITAGTGAATGEEKDRYLAGIRLDEISRGFKDASHPLSSKFAVLSSANGCELEEWKTVAAYQIRAYELLELQWSIPTERVYIPPVNLQDTIRVPANGGSEKSMFKQTWDADLDAGPDAEALCLEPYFEGWVYVLKGGVTLGRADKTSKSSSKPGKWKLHWITVKGWRIDLYRKKPRAGEAVLPVAEQTWPLRAIDWVIESENPIATNAALPALDTMPLCSITIALSPRGGGSGASGSILSSPGSFASSSATSSEVSTLTFRCISRFDHEAISALLVRAWYRSSTTLAGVDTWRRKAVFRALVAGRGGTVAAGRVGRGRGGRNAKARIRLRPSGWPKEWEDADQWSSESEREEICAPAELEKLLQQRRDTMTQVKADRGKKQEVDERMVVPNGLYAALLGRTAGSSTISGAGAGSEGEAVSSRGGANASMMDSSPYHQGSVSSSGGRTSLVQSPSLPHMEPGLMLGSNAFDRRLVHPTKRSIDDGSSKSKSRQRSGSLSRSPDPSASDSNTSLRSRSLTVSSPSGTCRGGSNVNSANSSRNVSREASPLRSSSSARKASGTGSGGGGGYAMSPALAPGFIDVPPPPSVLLLRKYKASQKANSNPT
ncbi:uncharacterized protein UTRI_04215 [Ustilago trichophora]|uniref:PH domain-containing protein n=1 Tax=Ustilago trichophora TaxID=86804 RepID=A0A5C3ET27_9BASI|nr:uncharacterized protein UTRI_04215 [Ustilago trichophora]